MKNMYSHWLCLLLCSLLTPLSGMAQNPTPTYQISPNHVYRIVSHTTGQALEIGGNNRTAPGHSANLWGYWGGAHQQWTFKYVPNNYGSYYCQIINRNSGQVLEVADARRSYAYTAFNGSGVNQNYRQSISPASYIGDNDFAQTWVITSNPGTVSPVTIKLLANGQYLTGDANNNVYQDQARSGVSQTWDIIDVSANPTSQQSQGVFQIVNRNSGKVLGSTEDSNGNPDSGANQESYTGLAGQQWTFTDYDATYTSLTVSLNKCFK
jgi:hypothetical protein